jgi:hypothetical protein
LELVETLGAFLPLRVGGVCGEGELLYTNIVLRFMGERGPG